MSSHFMISLSPKNTKTHHAFSSSHHSPLQNLNQTCWKMEFQKHLGVGLMGRCCDLGVGMKVVIASAAFMSSPVWIPPLVVLLMVGFAFSVPFGVLFAGYAASRRIARAVVRTAVVDPVAENGMGEGQGFGSGEGGGERYDFAEKSREGKEEMGKVAIEPPFAEFERPSADSSVEEKIVAPEHESAASTKTMTLDRDVFFETEEGEELEGLIESFDSASPVIEETVGMTPLVRKLDGIHGFVEQQSLKPMTEETVRDIEVVMPKDNKEMVNNEQKIRDQIEAMRTIIGCKVERNPSCMEELKTLYLFTGVEPPVSSISSCDLAQVFYV